MEMRAGREAGRADITDELALADEGARMRDDPAHMAVHGLDIAVVRDPDEIAIAAGPARADHAAVGRRDDWRAVARREIEAACIRT